MREGLIATPHQYAAGANQEKEKKEEKKGGRCLVETLTERLGAQAIASIAWRCYESKEFAGRS